MLETSEASLSAALQRERGRLRKSLPEDRQAWRHPAETTETPADERDLRGAR